jgi:membrane dipeptidase
MTHPQEDELIIKADAIHDAAVVVDSHCDTAMRFNEPGFDFSARNAGGHVDLPRIREGGLDAVVMAVYLGKPDEAGAGKIVDDALERIAWIRTLAEKNPHALSPAVTAADVRRAAGEGKVALLVGIEGGHIIDGSLEVLKRFHALGARVLTLTHIFHNDLADSSGFGEPLQPLHGGLSSFGRSAVREMNDLGMIVDVSHASDAAFWDALETSEAPIMATHSACRALCGHNRNLTDEMIEALTDRGGVVQVPYHPRFIDPDYDRRSLAVKEVRAALEAEARATFAEGSEDLAKAFFRISREHPAEPTPLPLLLDHIERVIDLAGFDHVGLGSDWDGIPETVEGLEDCSRLRAVTRGLVARGLGESEVSKILGGNFLRVLEEVTDRALRSR